MTVVFIFPSCLWVAEKVIGLFLPDLSTADFSRGMKSALQNFSGKRVTVMGLGLHGGGVGTAKFFAKAGAKVLVTDLKSKKELAPSLRQLRGLSIRYILGKHRKEDFLNVDLIVQNPGVPDASPHLILARKHGIPIDTDIGIFFDLCKGFIIGITGTKGKSTTAALAASILKGAGIPVALGGNIRISALSLLPKIHRRTAVVLELSSWQVEGLARKKRSPQVSLITNILPDHLNRYRSLAHYRNAKSLIFAHQKPRDIILLNRNDPSTPILKKKVHSRIVLFDPHTAPLRVNAPSLHSAAFVNAAAAATSLVCALSLHPEWPHIAVQKKVLRKALARFRGLPGRLESIARIFGVTFVNDTTSTMPDAAIMALESFPQRRIILIAGGMDKNLAYASLARVILQRAKALVLFRGTASNKLLEALPALVHFPIVRNVDSMKEAVARAFALAEPGDTVLLSPAAASFNLFINEFDRGEQFVRAVTAQYRRARIRKAPRLHRDVASLLATPRNGTLPKPRLGGAEEGKTHRVRP